MQMLSYIPRYLPTLQSSNTYDDMQYAGIFRRYPNITFIASHAGGALPLLADRLELLGAEPWLPNPSGITKEEIKRSLRKLYFDTAAVGPAAVRPVVRLAGAGHVVYGADCGVPCSTEETMEENKRKMLAYEGLGVREREAIGKNVYALFPAAVERLRKGEKRE